MTPNLLPICRAMDVAFAPCARVPVSPPPVLGSANGSCSSWPRCLVVTPRAGDESAAGPCLQPAWFCSRFCTWGELWGLSPSPSLQARAAVPVPHLSPAHGCRGMCVMGTWCLVPQFPLPGIQGVRARMWVGARVGPPQPHFCAFSYTVQSPPWGLSVQGAPARGELEGLWLPCTPKITRWHRCSAGVQICGYPGEDGCLAGGHSGSSPSFGGGGGG